MRTARDEYFLLKGLRQGCMLAIELGFDEQKIREAIRQYSVYMKVYRDELNLGDVGEVTITEEDLNARRSEV